MNIRKSCVEDLDAYISLRAASIRALAAADHTAEQIEDWVREIDMAKIGKLFQEGRFFVGCGENGEMICAGTWVGQEISNLYVAPTFARKGWGKLLLSHIEEDYARKTGNSVIQAKAANNARSFYESNGYVFISMEEWTTGAVPSTYSLLEKNFS